MSAYINLTDFNLNCKSEFLDLYHSGLDLISFTLIQSLSSLHPTPPSCTPPILKSFICYNDNYSFSLTITLHDNYSETLVLRALLSYRYFTITTRPCQHSQPVYPE